MGEALRGMRGVCSLASVGDGRHRQDPRGHSRYLIAGLGLVLVLALLATGAYALYSVLTAEAEPQASAAAAASAPAAHPPRHDSVRREPARHASVTRQPVLSPPPEAAFSGPPTLALNVTGSRSYVSVSLPSGKTLINTTLEHGQTIRFHYPRLTVTVGDPAAVLIAVNGERRNTGQRGITTFRVSPPD